MSICYKRYINIPIIVATPRQERLLITVTDSVSQSLLQLKCVNTILQNANFTT